MLQVAQSALLLATGFEIDDRDIGGRELVKSRSVTSQVVTAASMTGTHNGGKRGRRKLRCGSKHRSRGWIKISRQTEKRCDSSAIYEIQDTGSLAEEVWINSDNTSTGNQRPTNTVQNIKTRSSIFKPPVDDFPYHSSSEIWHISLCKVERNLNTT